MDERHQHECQDAEAGFQMRIMMLVDGYQDLIRLRDAQTERLEVSVPPTLLHSTVYSSILYCMPCRSFALSVRFGSV